MSVTIRLQQRGRKNHRTFRIVVTDKRNPRGGKCADILGHYDPKKEQLVTKPERIQDWLKAGAEMTEKAEALLSQDTAILKAYKAQLQARKTKRAAARRRRRQAKNS